jgi:hypothetical protein
MDEDPGMKHSCTPSQIAAFRLTRHHFTGRRPADLVAVARNVCGIQAQVMSAAQMALWARAHDVTKEDIHSARLQSRTLVRTSCMRQTLHLIPGADFSIYISALKRSRCTALMRVMSRFGITRKDVEGLNEAVVGALGGGPLTQGELIERVAPVVGKNMRAWMERVWGVTVFRPALVDGLICYGPDRGREVTFVRVDQWMAGQKAVPEGEAKQVLFRRYLGTYGPATLQDFSRWAGIPMAEARPVRESLEDELVEVPLGDKSGVLLRKDRDALANSRLGEEHLRLLPGFDPYLLGHAEKDHLVESSHYKRVYRNQGWISPVVLHNGRVIGVWSSTRRGKRPSLAVELFGKSSKKIRGEIENEAASLGAFLRTQWDISFTQGA